MDSDASENNSVPLDKTNDELQRSRSPLETVAEEAEGRPFVFLRSLCMLDNALRSIMHQ